ncbi:probable galacturonosyltransferase 6 [Typha angustifolia]|uniref:probable galacturonosyltransferase 6 n=1 Tax=Typha angustifolia TaxID=59011 RepID=UPI003C2C249B
MKFILRPPRSLFLGLLFVILVGFLYVGINLPTDLSSSHDNESAQKVSSGEISGLVKNFSPGHIVDSIRLDAITQDTDTGLKEPTGIVYKEYESHNPLNRSNTNDHYVRPPDAPEGFQSGNDSGGGLHKHTVSVSTTGEKRNLSDLPTVEDNRGLLPQSTTNEKIWEMEDQLIVAKAYLHFAPPGSNSHLVRELKVRIREIERILSQAKKDSDLSKSGLQKIRAMEATLCKAHKVYPDCSAMASKLRAMTYYTEEQLRAQQNEASYLMQVAASTLPKGLHCLSMRLTSEYFTLQPQERKLQNRDKVQKPDLYHYAIFSDNLLACAVVVNSTIFQAKEPEKIVFHVVTDSLNFPAMMMWFLLNPPSPATIQIENLDELKQLPPGFSSMFKQPGIRDARFTSALNHLRFYLPDIFPSLSKVLLLDHDVVVQKDLSELWRIDMKDKVNGAVVTCREGKLSHQLQVLLNFSDPIIANSFDPKACVWAFGMNMFNLEEWRRHGLTRSYHKWLQVGKKRQLWKAGSLPIGQLIFYNHTHTLDSRWHVLGLGQDSSIGRAEVEGAAVVHYNGNMKPWLEVSIPKFRYYWNKYLNYDNTYLQQCNIHE